MGIYEVFTEPGALVEKKDVLEAENYSQGAKEHEKKSSHRTFRLQGGTHKGAGAFRGREDLRNL